MKLPWTAKANATDAGKSAESYAADFLKAQGLAIIASNYRGRRGEIDLIARKGEVLIFVEVRLRNHSAFAGGAESVDQRKQRRITATAALYLHQHYGANPPPCRFDVVSLASKADNSGSFCVHWIEDAFRPES